MNSISNIRLKKGMSQNQLSALLNVDRTTVTKWETGKAKPRADKLLKLSSILGCSVEEILKEEK